VTEPLTIAERDALAKIVHERLVAIKDGVHYLSGDERETADLEVANLRQAQAKLGLRDPGYDCKRCDGTRLELGGWMGPTDRSPYPKPCRSCASHFTRRELQAAYARYLHSAPPGIAERGLKTLGQNLSTHSPPSYADGEPPDYAVTTDIPF
jgi:hypothetical protein